MKVFLDTNVLIAGCIEEHEHHSRAVPILSAVHAGKTEGFVSGHSLLEMHAILTRLPRAPRVSPGQAASLIEENVLNHFTVVSLSSKEYSDLAKKLGRIGISGGQAYDLLHLACAEKAHSDRVYTFNIRHFLTAAPHLSDIITAP